MLDKLKAFFKSPQAPLRLGSSPQDMRMAVCAVLLEAAEVDQQVPASERRTIRELLKQEFALSDGAVEALIADTRTARNNASDLWPFTTAIARDYSPEQKLNLLQMVWQVIFADDRLDPYEEQLARRLQAMLSVNHSLLMEAKKRAREARAVV
ncbi:MAG: TerB family tellurite resistance protein [Candidatus Lambdaproteobacteria bacterium]|nr:TerB family tellurite resistance protein [Candidatus Lambdaproteobacteria bacterium]